MEPGVKWGGLEPRSQAAGQQPRSKLQPGVSGLLAEAERLNSERLARELGVTDLAALRATCRRNAKRLKETWGRVRYRCELGRQVDEGSWDRILPPEALRAMRGEADRRFGSR